MFHQSLKQLSNRPKPQTLSAETVEAWLAENGNGIERAKRKSKAFVQAGKKTPPVKPWKKQKPLADTRGSTHVSTRISFNDKENLCFNTHKEHNL